MNKVGIFWFAQNKLVFIAELATHYNADQYGLIDSAFLHIHEWEKQHIYSRFGLKLVGTEYQQYPRGRVIFDTNLQRTHVFLDKHIFKTKVKNQIITAFNLHPDTTKWFDDPHYRCF
ncbi:hypothetical protein NQT69_12085 [Pseudoalteromonas shioyasakiensis]|uniref:hypothetical protein n=1 Tax=Pseudoalteromonas shioyasakiensis TaxID=1190813 RepID=UPI002117F125|nr:hypothetical protein [Pseudoalteromonas shioyasakiensis]MCQ8878742.1 hypothetical protein [Pseudoalteromonas shioyasakiensis]